MGGIYLIYVTDVDKGQILHEVTLVCSFKVIQIIKPTQILFTV